jgi:hypothetical protein
MKASRDGYPPYRVFNLELLQHKPGVLTAQPLCHAFVRGCGLNSTDSMQGPVKFRVSYVVPISS